MNQMTSVLNETKRLVPPNHAEPHDEPIVEARPVQYSAHHKHIIHLTYDSSEGSDDSHSDYVDTDPPKPHSPQPPPRPVAPPLRT